MDKNQQYECVFNYFDENRDGKISPSELQRCVEATGGELSSAEAEAAVKLSDTDGDGLLGLDDFVRFVEDGEEEEKEKDLKEAFRMYELEGSACITAKSLKRMLSRLGESRSMQECKVMIAQYDLNGSKDQIFFDSRPWLESDCEDDFFSINGDFTPSRGNTPVHHSFSVGTPQVSRIPLEDRSPASVPEPSPTGKKTLSEHFQDSLQEDQNVNNPRPSSDQNITVEKTEVKPTVLDVLPKSAHVARPVLGANPICSSERTVNGDLLFEGDKSLKSARCCFPSLVSCHSLSERKKKMSPAVAANGKA